MKAFACTLAAIMASAVMAAPVAPLPADLPALPANLPAIPSVATDAISKLPSLPVSRRGTGEIVTDAAKPVGQLLTVVGEDSKQLLLELSPEVTALVAGLGLPAVGVVAGEVIATASSVGELVKDVVPGVGGLLTVVGTDGKFLLIQLGADVAVLLSGLGLPGVGIPVGAIIATVGEHVKRAGPIHGVAATAITVVTIVGQDSEKLLLQLNPEVAALVAGLALPLVGEVAGEVIAVADTVDALLKHVVPGVEGLLHIVKRDADFLLIQLTADVAGLLVGLGLPALVVPIGTVVGTLVGAL